MDATVVVEPARDLHGTIRVGGDKSITHRALFFAALNSATTTINDASPADDCARSLAVIQLLGCSVEQNGLQLRVSREPLPARDHHPDLANSNREIVIDCGNSGTTARLAVGLLAAEPGRYVLVGDPSLTGRPMERVAAPLRRMGATVTTTNGALPIRITGGVLIGGDSHGVITVESAQVHAAVVIAALRSQAGASIFAARPMRDHTLRMLRAFGISFASSDGVVRILPTEINRNTTIDVPGDFSSAAFLITAAVLVRGSSIVIDRVGLNPTRIAFVRALQRMGADIVVSASDDIEPVGSIRARYSPELVAAEFDGDDPVASVTEMIDELPLLALVATQARGTTLVHDADELRVKESDRINSTASVLRSLGAVVTEMPDGLEIRGSQTLEGGQIIDACGDHRLAMMAAIGAMVSLRGATVAGADAADVSYPAFWDDLVSLGAHVKRI